MCRQRWLRAFASGKWVAACFFVDLPIAGLFSFLVQTSRASETGEYFVCLCTISFFFAGVYMNRKRPKDRLTQPGTPIGKTKKTATAAMTIRSDDRLVGKQRHNMAHWQGQQPWEETHLKAILPFSHRQWWLTKGGMKEGELELRKVKNREW